MQDSAKTVSILKAISDPIRWDIVCQMTNVDELACSALEETLPISKPTISYHIRILVQANLVTVRKNGRHFFYTLNRKVLGDLVGELWILAPESERGQTQVTESPAGRAERDAQTLNGPVLLTW